jgi:hypothetical protein
MKERHIIAAVRPRSISNLCSSVESELSATAVHIEPLAHRSGSGMRMTREVVMQCGQDDQD